jgi:TolB-like protein/DNA-binding SARP family transcriptional activator
MNPSSIVDLRLFGSPSLSIDGVILSGRAAQRHRLALLALLALSPGQRLNREKLLAYLWPERDTESGRNLLKVSTYVLRATLGDRALLSEGEDLRLNTEIVRVDVAAFESWLERKEPATAVGLYTAPFLDGFFLSDAPELERWVTREGERLAGAYGKALESLAEGAESERDFARAVECWRKRAAQDPYDSRVAARLIKSLDETGNRAAAIQHAAIHQRLLKEELGISVAPEVAALVDRLRRDPAPDLPVVRPAETPALIPPATARPSSPEATRVGRRTRWLTAAIGLVSLALGSAIWIGLYRTSEREPSIVVLPFVNLSSDRDNEFFSDGLTEEIIARLAAIPDLKVISRTSAMHYKGTSRPLREIARELKVAHVLEGSVREVGGRVRISAQLIDARGDEHLWAQSYDGKSEDSFRVQQQIAEEVARALEVKLGERTRTLVTRQGTRDPEASMLYRRGRFLWSTRTKDGHDRAIAYYRRAIERDSGYADAYAAMADVYLTAYQHGFMPEAQAALLHKETAERAIALDDRSTDAHTSFAVALWWQRDWPGAERELRRAIELNPGNANARAWYSLLLSGMGRQPEALVEGRRSADLDPFNTVAVSIYARHCYLSRDYDCAVEQYRNSVEISEFPVSYARMAVLYAQKGMRDDAVRAIRRAIELAPEHTDFLGDLAYVQASAGDSSAARESLGRAKQQVLEPFSIARAYVALAEPDSAFAWLERSSWLWPHRAVRSDPALDRLRSDPRFARLAARIEREMGMQPKLALE